MFATDIKHLTRRTMMLQQALQQRRAKMDAAWAELEGGWKELHGRMANVGTRSRTSKEDILRLNIGGSSVNVSFSHLAEVPGFRQSILGSFFEGVLVEAGPPRCRRPHGARRVPHVPQAHHPHVGQ